MEPDVDGDAMEELLATWDRNPGVDFHGRRYWLYGERGGIRLYTRPARVIRRLDPREPAREVAGVSYVFVDTGGNMVRDFDGAPRSQPQSDTFAGFLAAHAGPARAAPPGP
jgi:hypothetical protein